VKDFRKTLLIIILYTALAAYLIALIWGGVLSVKAMSDYDSELPSFISILIITLGSTIATIFAGYLGITIQDYHRKPDRQSAFLVMPSFKNRSTWDVLTDLDFVRFLTVVVYFLSLLAGVVFWASTNFNESVFPVIQDLAWTLVGVFAGILALLGDQ
jgi:amino acid transporter